MTRPLEFNHVQSDSLNGAVLVVFSAPSSGDVGAAATERGRIALKGAEDVADRAMRLAEEAAREAKVAAGEFREDAEEWAQENAETLRTQVREQPITSLLIAGGIGAFLGAIFLRR